MIFKLTWKQRTLVCHEATLTLYALMTCFDVIHTSDTSKTYPKVLKYSEIKLN